MNCLRCVVYAQIQWNANEKANDWHTKRKLRLIGEKWRIDFLSTFLCVSFLLSFVLSLVLSFVFFRLFSITHSLFNSFSFTCSCSMTNMTTNTNAKHRPIIGKLTKYRNASRCHAGASFGSSRPVTELTSSFP